MKYEIDGKLLNVDIVRKKNKNTYIRIKDEDTIYVTTSYFVTKKQIKSLLDNNQKFIINSLNKIENSKKREEKFYYLGREYQVLIIPTFKDVLIDGDSIIAESESQLNKWVSNMIKKIFKERYDYLYEQLEEKVLKPTLKIRKMKTRWGVCNRKSDTITLNSELIKYDLECLDYVIIHELSHLVFFDHSKQFWKQVEKYCPNYKKIRKDLKN